MIIELEILHLELNYLKQKIISLNKPKILIFIDWFLPGYKAGGPIKSVSNMVNSLHQDFSFYIITSDKDIDDLNSYQNIELNKWITKENYSIVYLTPEYRIDFIKNELQNNPYSCIYFNSVFSKNYTIDPLRAIKKLKLASKIIIAPRGMLGKGALSLKPIKKKLFLTISKFIGLYKNVTWHATNVEEAQDIKTIFGNKVAVQIASNIAIIKTTNHLIEKLPNQLKLVFFSRISPKKNLLYAIDTLKKVADNTVELSIYGSIEDQDYWNECLSFIDRNNVNAKYISEINPSDVNKILSQYHFLFLPTLHENYGHVIVEALTAGCGLILSNNTPWKHLDKKNIGWEIELEYQNKFIEVIKKCIHMNQDEYNTIRNNCFSFVKDQIDVTKDISNTKKLFS